MHLLDAVELQIRQNFACKAKNIPSKGTICSHRGNTSFPVWERFIPTQGTLSNCFNGGRNINNAPFNSFIEKSLNPSRHTSESLINKGFQDFHPSLDPSRHLSHIPPVFTPSKRVFLTFEEKSKNNY